MTFYTVQYVYKKRGYTLLTGRVDNVSVFKRVSVQVEGKHHHISAGGSEVYKFRIGNNRRLLSHTFTYILRSYSCANK